jgi:hypothetical protein
VDHRRDLVAAERWRAGHDLVKQARQRIHVHAVVGGPAEQPLRRDVVVRSEHPTGRCSGDAARIADRRGNPEVREVAVHARFTRLDQDIRRLDVPVHDSGGVCGIQRPCDLPHDLDGTLGRELTRRCHGFGEIVTLDQPHVEIESAVDLAEVVDGDDVGLGQPSSASALLEEALAKLLVRDELDAEPLECHGPLAACVVRPVDLAHTAPADQFPQLVGAERVRSHLNLPSEATR